MKPKNEPIQLMYGYDILEYISFCNRNRKRIMKYAAVIQEVELLSAIWGITVWEALKDSKFLKDHKKDIKKHPEDLKIVRKFLKRQEDLRRLWKTMSNRRCKHEEKKR